MNDIELAALTQLVAAEQFEMDADNEQRRRNGFALAYSGAIDWPEREALEKELVRRKLVRPIKPA